MRIVVVEKDSALAEFIKEQLETEHYKVDLTANNAELLPRLTAKRYDLVILDIGPSSIEIIREIRSIRPGLLILVLSGNTDPETQLNNLDEGADDFITKPFYFSVLHSRIRALLRRRNNATNSVLSLEDLELNRMRRTVKRNGCTVDLTQKEFALLEFLMERPMQPVSRDAIAKNAWNLQSEDATANTVDVYINYIRKKLDSYGDRPLIRTIRGVGYQIGGAEISGQPRPTAND